MFFSFIPDPDNFKLNLGHKHGKVFKTKATSREKCIPILYMKHEKIEIKNVISVENSYLDITQITIYIELRLKSYDQLGTCPYYSISTFNYNSFLQSNNKHLHNISQPQN